MPAFLQRMRRLPGRALAIGCIAAAASTAFAAAPVSPGPVNNSSLDAPLFYQLLIGEIELRSGQAGAAYEVMLDAARRTRDEALFRRAVEIALQGRAGEQALAAVTAWRTALPQSLEAMRYHVQLLVALNKPAEAMEPLRALIHGTPVPEQPGLISSLPRFFQRSGDQKQIAALLEKTLQPYADAPATRAAVRVALGRTWMSGGDTARATALLELAHKDDPDAPGPALLALDMLPTAPAAEQVVTSYLQQPKAEPLVRLAYVRVLTSAQRYPEAVTQLEQLTKAQPDLPPPWLTLGALHLELQHPKEAEAALQRYVQLVEAGKNAPAPANAASAPADDDDDDATTPPSADRGRIQAWLLLSQAAEMRGDYKAAEAWLNKVDSPQRALEVQTRRAALLARQGKIKEARELVQKVPERSPDDARAKLLAEAQVLRDVKRWREANDVLATANKRFPDDADLLYEQAMMEEKLSRLDDMERLLRKVIELKPDHQHAYNALGYSLADRNLRLPEAKTLIEKALTLAPGEPFITDSLGWVEYRMGRRAEAITLLRKAYSVRPDTEIAAHLGEVLWVDGQRDEARRVLGDAKRRDTSNEVLSETLKRLKVDL